jgi:hypothetical protein
VRQGRAPCAPNFRQRTDRFDHAGVVDQDVRVSEPLNRHIDHRLDGRVFRNIAGDTAGLPAALHDRIGDPFLLFIEAVRYTRK